MCPPRRGSWRAAAPTHQAVGLAVSPGHGTVTNRCLLVASLRAALEAWAETGRGHARQEFLDFS